MAKPIALDMSKAITLEPMADNTKVLCVIDKWEPRTSSGGNPTLHIEYVVKKPETSGIVNRRLFDDINLENEYTLGRLKNNLKAFGWSEKDILELKAVPSADDMLGSEIVVVVGVRSSDTYGDRNNVKRVLPASSF
jgi:hypothetical protein